MQQLEIQYFFPLTEQIPLDLDFSPSVAYEEQKRKEMWANSVSLTVGNGVTTSYTFTTSKIEPNFTIDVDQTPITIVSKKKPNFVKLWIYKTLGMKWKSK